MNRHASMNRISGTDGSEILGHLDANGQVYLINLNGIVFGQGAEVNVGGLVASTSMGARVWRSPCLERVTVTFDVDSTRTA